MVANEQHRARDEMMPKPDGGADGVYRDPDFLAIAGVVLVRELAKEASLKLPDGRAAQLPRRIEVAAPSTPLAERGSTSTARGTPAARPISRLPPQTRGARLPSIRRDVAMLKRCARRSCWPSLRAAALAGVPIVELDPSLLAARRGAAGAHRLEVPTCRCRTLPPVPSVVLSRSLRRCSASPERAEVRCGAAAAAHGGRYRAFVLLVPPPALLRRCLACLRFRCRCRRQPRCRRSRSVVLLEAPPALLPPGTQRARGSASGAATSRLRRWPSVVLLEPPPGATAAVPSVELDWA